MQLSDLDFDKYHLYLGKTSSLRDQLLLQLQEVLITFSTEELWSRLPDVVEETQQLRDFEKNQRQLNYCLVDIILLTEHTRRPIEDIFNRLTQFFRVYIVIHEIAALSWGNAIIPPNEVFQLLMTDKLSEKHMYHIFNEMAVTYPKQVIRYVSEAINNDQISETMYDKLKSKMIRMRTRSRPLAKGVEPQLSDEEIKQFLENIEN